MTVYHQLWQIATSVANAYACYLCAPISICGKLPQVPRCSLPQTAANGFSHSVAWLCHNLPQLATTVVCHTSVASCCTLPQTCVERSSHWHLWQLVAHTRTLFCLARNVDKHPLPFEWQQFTLLCSNSDAHTHKER